MQIKHIKESIKQKHSNNGNKNARNSYRIITTNQYRQVISNRKHKLSVSDSLKDLAITQDIKDIILSKWIEKGYNKKDISKIGIFKALEILKQDINININKPKKDFLRHF